MMAVRFTSVSAKVLLHPPASAGEPVGHMPQNGQPVGHIFLHKTHKPLPSYLYGAKKAALIDFK
jgi:hypothetical protein